MSISNLYKEQLFFRRFHSHSLGVKLINQKPGTLVFQGVSSFRGSYNKERSSKFASKTKCCSVVYKKRRNITC